VALDPEVFLIGGGVSREERFINDLRAKVFEFFPELERYTRIEPCSMGNNAGKVGALMVYLDTMEN